MSARRTSFWVPTLRAAACLLLVAIAADLCADSRCDVPSSRLSAPTAVRDQGQPQGESDEPCASFCVPDCFCCSISETAGPVLTLPPLTALAQAPSTDPASVPAVVRTVPEPPPLALS